MDKTEFNQRHKLIESIRSEANNYKEETLRQLEIVKNSIEVVMNNLKDREDKMEYYINALDEFSYSDVLTVPSDLFPGLRTTSDMADPEELRDRAETMKAAAGAVKAISTLVSSQSNKGLGDINNLSNLYSNCIRKYIQLYSLEMDLVNDMDSIYDIGDIARNT